MAQEPRTRGEISIRTVGTASSAPIDAIRGTMMNLDPDLPIRRLQPADASIDFANYQWAVVQDLLSCFAALGLGLASLGIYGVVAHTMASAPANSPSASLWERASGTYVFEPSFLDRVPLGERVSIERVTFPAMVEDRRALRVWPTSPTRLDTGTPDAYLQAHRRHPSGAASP